MKVLPRSMEEIAQRLGRDIQEVAAAATALGIRPYPTHAVLASNEAWRLLSFLQGGGRVLPPHTTEIGNDKSLGSLSGHESGGLAVEENSNVMAQQLAQREERIAGLENELLSAKEDIRSLKLQVDRLERLAQQLRESLAESNDELSAAQVGHIRFIEDTNKLQHAAAVETLRLNRRVNRLEDINRSLRLKLQRGSGANQRLRASQERLKRLEERALNLQRHLRVAREATRLARANELQLKTQVGQLNATNEKLKKSLAKLELDCALLKNRVLRADTTSERTRKSRLSGKEKKSVQRQASRPNKSKPAQTGDQLADNPAYATWLKSLKGRRRVVFRKQVIVLIGTDPYTTRRLKSALADSQCSFTKPGSADAGVVIVGRDGWLIDDIEDQIKARSGKTLRIYSQEMALLAIEHGHDLFDTASPSLLRKLASGHPALQCLMEDGFMWPAIDTARITERLRNTWNERAGESPLHKMGYHVGKRSEISQRERRDILEDAFRGKIPFAVSKDYMLNWGTPGSRRRLRRIATHISWNVGGAHGRERQLGHDMDVALAHWREDLGWMKSRLYEGWMCFRWPKVTV